MGGGPYKDYLLCLQPGPEPTAILSRLRKRFPHVEIVYHSVSLPFHPAAHLDAAAIPPEQWAKVTILYTLFTFPPSLSSAPSLSWVQLSSAGSNQIQTHPIYTDTDAITITTSSGIHGPQIAEWVIMTALVQSHKYNSLHDLQKAHRWGSTPGSGHDADYRSVRDLVGQRLGVLGYGSIGRQVGRVAKAMGMEVYAYTATPKDTPEKRRDGGFIVPGTGDAEGEIPAKWFSGLEKEKLHEFLRQDLDWLIVAVPLTEQTTKFLSTEEFRILGHEGKRPAFVTNIARGRIIDQPALITALKDGTLSGAALDVTDPEPLPEDSELWDLPNVTVTPHVSGIGEAYMERSFQLLEANLERREKGERLLNVVRRERGY